MANIPKITLNNGVEMPQVGFGLWKVPAESAADVVYNAIQAGYRLFDGAYGYANEKECGQGIQRAIADGLVKREDLFIVSKLWNTFHEKEHVAPICKQQLEWWGIDYFDLYIMHFPVALKYVSVEEFYPADWAHHTIGEVIESKATIQETWGAMESLIDLGLTKTIGVSNFAAALLIDLFRYARIPPATLQIEHHPYLVQPELVSFAKARGMAVTAYSSFGPQSFLELNYESAISALPLFDNPTILELSKKYEKSPAQVLLRWSTQRGLAVIPKSNSPHRLLENLHCTGFNMEESDIKKISALDKGLRFNDPRDITDHLPIFV